MLTPLQSVEYLVLSSLMGLVIGFVNLRAGRPGGMRTYILVSVGATLVTMVSTNYFIGLGKQWTADPGRLGAQVVSALSFMGVGMIWLAEEKRVGGMSSAASLWLTALVGMMLGSSCGPAVIVAFVFCVVIFIVLDFYLERRYLNAKTGRNAPGSSRRRD